jgi:hypothetical protein
MTILVASLPRSYSEQGTTGDQAPPLRLLAVLATPPLSTSGERTLARVQMAAALIGSDSISVVNLLRTPTNNVNEVRSVGATAEPWLNSRPALLLALRQADAVLLGWGAEPIGPARHHHRDQVTWLLAEILTTGLPSWTVGGQSRHPSRWQRYTARTHPELDFPTALALTLRSDKVRQAEC